VLPWQAHGGEFANFIVRPRMLLSHHQNARQNHNVKIANRSIENVAQFKYLGTRITSQSFIQDTVKRRLNLGNACYHSVQYLLSSSVV
jgi:hypothetical protein